MNDWFDWQDLGKGPGRFGGFGPFQARRGDIQPILLSVLAERPMHGYEIIRYLEEKSHGFWRPSPGSVYPTLQLLEEQDFVTSRDHGGKKIYELTESGRTEAAANAASHKGPWEWDRGHFDRLMQMRASIAGIMRPFKTIARTGTQAQADQAAAIMTEAAAKLNALLEPAQTATSDTPNA